MSERLAMSENAGRRGKRWQRLKANLRMERRPCCLCGQPIDYSLAWPDPGSFSVEHLRPWSLDPAGREDPANLGASHLGCNSSRQTKEIGEVTLGDTSESW